MKKYIFLQLILIIFLVGCQLSTTQESLKTDFITYQLFSFNDRIFAMAEKVSDNMWSINEITENNVITIVSFNKPPQNPFLFNQFLYVFSENLKIDLTNNEVTTLSYPAKLPEAILSDDNTMIVQFDNQLWFHRENIINTLAIPDDFILINFSSEGFIFYDQKQFIYFTDKEFNITKELSIVLSGTEKNQLLSVNPGNGFLINDKNTSNLYYEVSDTLRSIAIKERINKVIPLKDSLIMIGKGIYEYDYQNTLKHHQDLDNNYEFVSYSSNYETLKILAVNTLISKSLIISISLSSGREIHKQYFDDKYNSIIHNSDFVYLGANLEIIKLKHRIIK